MLNKPVSPKSKYFMAGTQNTGEYVTVAQTALGRCGLREYAPGCFRIRVEPTAEGVLSLAAVLTRAEGWKQPGDSGQNRFSICVGGKKSDETVADVTKALHALVSGGHVPTAINTRAPAFARKLVSHEGLVAAVKAKKVPGANLASTWPTAKVCAKL